MSLSFTEVGCGSVAPLMSVTSVSLRVYVAVASTDTSSLGL